MLRALVSVVLVLAASGCGARTGMEAIPRPDELRRPTAGTSAQVLQAAQGVLTQLVLPVEPQDGPGTRVMSSPVLVQETWFPGPVSDRLLCGVPLTRQGVASPRSVAPGYDLGRAIEFTQRLPVRVRVGFEVAERVGGTSTRLIVQASALRESLWGEFDDELACVPTRAFADSVFEMLARELGS